jgi:hypothetical protein
VASAPPGDVAARKFARFALAALLAAAIGAGCGGDDDGENGGSAEGDPNTAITVRFSDGIIVLGSRDAWGDALAQRVDSGEITCEAVAEGRETCESDESSTQADWVPDGLIRLQAPPG